MRTRPQLSLFLARRVNEIFRSALAHGTVFLAPLTQAVTQRGGTRFVGKKENFISSSVKRRVRFLQRRRSL